MDHTIHTDKRRVPRFTRQLSGTQIAIGFLVIFPYYYYFGSWILTAFLKFLMLTFGFRMTALELNSWLNLLMGLSMLAMLVLLLGSFIKPQLEDFKKNKKKYITRGLMTFVGILLANYIGSAIVMVLGGSGTSVNQSNIDNIMASVPIPMLIYVVLVGPIVEELLFRGILFTTLRRYSRLLAFLVTALAFGFMHVSSSVFSGNIGEIVQIFPYFFAGLVLCYAYDSSNNICVSTIGHICNNLLSVIGSII